jgi:hypothetical protein
MMGCGRGAATTSENADAASPPSSEAGDAAALTPSASYQGRFHSLRVTANGVESTVHTPPRHVTPRHLATVHLPETADGEHVVRAPGGVAVHARLVGAAPSKASLEADVVRYRGAFFGHDLEQRTSEYGTEDFLRLTAPLAKNEARWSMAVEGIAGLRLVDSVLELVDADGDPRLRVTRPTIVDRNGKGRFGELTVEGCAVDTSTIVPWGRPTTPMGASNCTVVVRWDDAGLEYPLVVDPAWVTTMPMSAPRYAHAAASTTDSGTCSAGCVVVSGGYLGPVASVAETASTEVFNMKTSSFTMGGPLPGGSRNSHQSVDFTAGAVITAGGYHAPSVSTASEYWTSTGGWKAIGGITNAQYVTLVTMPGYGAMLIGAATAVSPLIVFRTSATPTWSTSGTAPPVALQAPLVAVLPSDDFCAAQSGDTHVYCYLAGSWTTLPGTITLGGRSGDFFDGTNWYLYSSGSTSDASIDLVTMSGTPKISSTTTTVSIPSHGPAHTPWSAGRAIFAGGNLLQDNSNAGVSYYMAGGTLLTDTLNNARVEHTTTALPNAVLVAGGGVGNDLGCNSYTSSLSTAELLTFAPAGAACLNSGECASGLLCADGVCCNSACNGICESCTQAGHVGTCTPQPAGNPAAGHGTCPGTAGGVCGDQCDGTTRTSCTYPPTSTVCSAQSCSGQTLTKSASCTGAFGTPAGTCPAASTSNCAPFKCNAAGTDCATTCLVNTDCTTGYRCSGGSCVSTGAAGASCSVPSDCSSGLSCVNGACCTSSSCPTGYSCNVTGAAGSCKLPLGTACTSDATCGSGHCVDGVCCNGLCNGQCEQCNGAGTAGQCTPVAYGQQPSGARTKCGGTGACQASCDGTNRTACGAYPPPTTVCAAASCASSTATATSYCDGLGSCSTGSTSPCAPFVCGTTACLASCTSDANCQPGYFCSTMTGTCSSTGALGTACGKASQCSSGFCVDGVCCATGSCGAGLTCAASGSGTCAKPLGATCASNTECGSAHCADGVCCNTGCTGLCESCNQTGAAGSCTPIPSGSAPATGHGSCTGTGVCAATCNGTTRTSCGATPGTSTACGAPSCTGASLVGTSYCDGVGTCTAPGAATCGGYKCASSSACGNSCTVSADCATGYACKAGMCVTTGGLGTTCTDPTQCMSGNCVPSSAPGVSVCCSASSCGAGSYCADTTAGTAAGSCVKGAGSSCASSAECGSGFCTDGVCCESVCNGQCEACDVPGAIGKCVGVTGAPHGARTACSDGAGSICAALACDGSADRTKCAAFKNGLDVECQAECADVKTLSVAHCDGMGSCGATKTTSCVPYVCENKACATVCKSNADCATDYQCDTTTGICSPITSTCSADFSSAQRNDGSAPQQCSPYLCQTATGACPTTCTGSQQCASGFSCQSGSCVASTSSGSSGCAISGGPRTGSGDSTTISAAVAGLAMALLATRRAQHRRRARR